MILRACHLFRQLSDTFFQQVTLWFLFSCTLSWMDVGRCCFMFLLCFFPRKPFQVSMSCFFIAERCIGILAIVWRVLWYLPFNRRSYKSSKPQKMTWMRYLTISPPNKKSSKIVIETEHTTPLYVFGNFATGDAIKLAASCPCVFNRFCYWTPNKRGLSNVTWSHVGCFFIGDIGL